MTQKQWIGLGIVAVLFAGAYVWVYGRDRVPPVEVMAVSVPGSDLQFSFNGDVTVREVMVFRPAEGADLDDELAYIEGEMMWHLVPRENGEAWSAEGGNNAPQPVKAIRYGRGLGWLQAPEGRRRRGEALEPGVQYVFVATLDEGRAQVVFTHVDGGG